MIEGWLRANGGFQWIAPEAGRHRVRPLRPPGELDRAGQPAARGEERADRARRSLRHGRLPAPRLRRAARLHQRRPRPRARTAGVAARASAGRVARMSRPELSPGPGRLRPRGAPFRAAARRGRRSARLHVAGRRDLHAASRQRHRRRRHRRRRARMVDGRRRRSRSIASIATPRERSGIDVIRQVADALADEAAEGRLVCVETTVLDIDRGEPAVSHVRAALEGQAHVVTANKGPAAFAYHELEALAESVDRIFFFEGAVMDGVPVFNLVRETHAGGGHRRLSRRHQHHLQLHPVGARARQGVRPGARRDAGARHRRGRSVARHRRLGRGRQDRRARQRADGQRDDAAPRRAHRASATSPASTCARRSAADGGSGWWRRRRGRAARSRRRSNPKCWIDDDPLYEPRRSRERALPQHRPARPGRHRPAIERADADRVRAVQRSGAHQPAAARDMRPR